MKRVHVTPNQFPATPFMADEKTAHSGPELVSSVPNGTLANALATSLLSDHTRIVSNVHRTSVGDSHLGSGSISLRRL
jgi:hypothetical protein